MTTQIDSLHANFEESACEICGHEERRKVAARSDLFLGGDQIFYHYECLNCGAIYQFPRPKPDQLAKYYPDQYQQYTPPVSSSGRFSDLFRRYGLKKRGQFISRYVKNGRLLDVGCATGDFLFEMITLPGWAGFGIEPNHSALRSARMNHRLDVVEGFLNDPPFPQNTFDAITMWDVLEHVYDPFLVIQMAERLLRPGGVLVVNHPNLESIDRKLFGDLWLGYELPRHLYLFPTNLLRKLMMEVGLIEIERRGLYGSHAATASSIMFVVERHLGVGRSSRLIRSILFSRFMRIIAIPYFKIVDALKLGSNVTVVFQKSK